MKTQGCQIVTPSYKWRQQRLYRILFVGWFRRPQQRSISPCISAHPRASPWTSVIHCQSVSVVRSFSQYPLIPAIEIGMEGFPSSPSPRFEGPTVYESHIAIFALLYDMSKTTTTTVPYFMTELAKARRRRSAEKREVYTNSDWSRILIHPVLRSKRGKPFDTSNQT